MAEVVNLVKSTEVIWCNILLSFYLLSSVCFIWKLMITDCLSIINEVNVSVILYRINLMIYIEYYLIHSRTETPKDKHFTKGVKAGDSGILISDFMPFRYCYRGILDWHVFKRTRWLPVSNLKRHCLISTFLRLQTQMNEELHIIFHSRLQL